MTEYKLVPTEILDRFPEINPSNYDHSDACALNAWGVELVQAAVDAPDVQGEPVAWLPYLTDRADGVTGHYAIARKNPAGYREVWNLRHHRWAAFSDEVLTMDEALAILKKLEMPTAPQPAEQQPTKTLTECPECQGHGGVETPGHSRDGRIHVCRKCRGDGEIHNPAPDGATQPTGQRCEYCDGTGDVHSLDGEWRGACDCQHPAEQQPTIPYGISRTTFGGPQRFTTVGQQPAPDVAGLVDALTMARETIASALRANAPDYFTTDADIARHVVIQRIDNALAAHSKQGGGS